MLSPSLISSVICFHFYPQIQFELEEEMQKYIWKVRECLFHVKLDSDHIVQKKIKKLPQKDSKPHSNTLVYNAIWFSAETLVPAEPDLKHNLSI